MDFSILNPFVWSSEPFIALIILLLILRFKLSTPTTRGRRIASETLAIGPAVLLYFLVRGFVNARFDDASANAQRIIDLEISLGIHREAEIQEMILDSELAVNVMNWIYIWGHWPVIAGVIFWLVFTRPAHYPRYRNALILSGALGMIIFATFPVTPPRLMDGMLFVDTVTDRSQSYRVFQPPGLTNPYAAMPSLHFGWNLLMGIAIVQQSRRVWTKSLGMLMPVAMYLAIVLTANHYFLDGVVGGVLVLTSLAVITRAGRIDPGAWRTRAGRNRRAPAAVGRQSWTERRRSIPLTIAHRCGNSRETLRAAEALGADVIEADVWLYRGRLEIRHTKTMGPLPLLWDRWYLQRGSTPRPALAEILGSTRPGTLLMLDIKGRDPEIARRVIAELRQHHANREVLVCSQNWRLLEPFRFYPHATIVHSIGNRYQLGRAWTHLASDECNTVSIQFRLLDAAVVHKLQEHGVRIFSWPVNSRDRFQEAMAWGLDGVITDDLSLVTKASQTEQREPVPQW